MANPDQLFIINQISRRTIASDINEQFEDELKAARTQPFAPDDDRLTDEICGQIADFLGDDMSETEDERGDKYTEFLSELCEERGWIRRSTTDDAWLTKDNT